MTAKKRKPKKYIKRSLNNIITHYELICQEGGESYLKAKETANKKGLKFIHRDNLLYVEVDGVSPILLKKYNQTSLETLYDFILEQKDMDKAKDIISNFNATQTQAFWELIPKEETKSKTHKLLHNICFERMAKLAKGE
jgi:hypothetical protein